MIHKLGEVTAIDGKHRWIYELRFDKDTDIGMLMRKTTPASSVDTEMISSSKTALPPPATHKAVVNTYRIAKLKAHQDMLGTLYHVQPAFSHSSFESARRSILLLADVAKVYDCEHVIKLHIENHLRLYRTEVLDLCASNPLEMLALATAAKSEWIYMEAATNLLGRSNRFFHEAQDDLIELGIADMLNKKRAEFVARLLACELALFRVQPSSTGIWPPLMAVACFRQWLGEQLQANKGSGLDPGYASIYHSIARGKYSIKKRAQEYLDSTFTGSNNMLPEMQTELGTIFTSAAQIVQPILVDLTRRQNKTVDAHRSLLCMGIDDDELPWVKK